MEKENGKTIEILTNEYTFHYDQNENILEEIYRKWSDDQSEYTIESTSYIYDKEGKLSEKYVRNGDSQHPPTDDFAYKTIYSYDDKGRLVEQVYYDMEQTYYEYYKSKDGEIKEYLWNTTTTTYDEESNSVETIYNRGVSMMKITTKYDENRNMIEEICECGYDRENEIYKYEYNDKKEIIIEYKENFNGDVLTKTTNIKYTNGNITDVVFQEYDENGSETDIFNIKQVYDKYGNMIHQTTCVNGELIGMQRSEIEYYN